MAATPDTRHLTVHRPTDPGTKIWRYMSLAKFVSLLETRKLYFTRSDAFNDPYEGLLPDGYTAYAREPTPPTWTTPEQFRNAFGTRITQDEVRRLGTKGGLVRLFRTIYFVNCWHMNEGESAAMWAYYGRHGESVAIQSSYQHLQDSLDTSHVSGFDIGEVQYYDYRTVDWGTKVEPLSTILSKRESFKHDQELRALFEYKQRSNQEKGKALLCDTNTLIDAVYTAPTEGEWFRKAVEGAMKAFGIAIKPERSDVYTGPLW